MKKQIACLLLAIGVTACGSSGNSSSSGSSPSPATTGTLNLGTLATIPVGLNDESSTNNSVESSQFSAVNSSSQKSAKTTQLKSGGASGSNSGSITYITIVNNLNTTANLQNIKVTGDSTVKDNPGWYIDTSACQKVVAQGVCNIAINPPNQDGYFVLTVNYDIGSSSQVVSYQRNIPPTNGFIFNNNNNLVVTKTLPERSAFSVPVVLTEDMSSLKVASNKPGLINTQLVCNGGSTTKSNVCTIMGQVQPGTVSGAASITLSGTSLRSGEEFTTTFPLVINNEQNSNLVTTGANVVLDPANAVTSKTVAVLNNGNVTASGITFVTNNPAISLTGTGACSSLTAGQSCNIDVSAHESQNFQGVVTINYESGVVGSTSFNVVYIAPESSPGLSYTTGGTGLTYTTINESSNYSVNVTNNGTVTLNHITPINIAAINPKLSYTTNGVISPCATDGSQSLDPGQSCTFQMHYAPIQVESGSFNFTVVGSYVNNAGETLSYSPGALAISYSAIGSPALLASNPNLWSFAIRANGVESSIESFVITNSGQESTVIENIQLSGAQMTIQSGAQQCIIGTVLQGESANSCKVYVKYGTKTTSESGVDNLAIMYKPTPVSSESSVTVPINYFATTAALVQVSSITATGSSSGNGALGTEFQFYNSPTNQLATTITYANSGTESALRFNVNLANLPSSIALDNTSTCGTGNTTSWLGKNESCTVVLKAVNTSIYNYLNVTGPIALPVPGFSYTDTNTGFNYNAAPFYAGIAGSTINIIANAFANVATPGATVTAANSATNVPFTLTFTSTAGDPASYPVVVNLLNTGGGIFSGSPSCTITNPSTSSNTCNISMTALAGLPAGSYFFQYRVAPLSSPSNGVLHMVGITVN